MNAGWGGRSRLGLLLVRLSSGNGRQNSGISPGFSLCIEAMAVALESVVEEENIDKRNAGCGAFIGDLLYIWGGM